MATGIRTYYYPSVRIIDPGMLAVLGPAYLLTYAPPTLLTFKSPIFPDTAWTIAYVVFPIVIYLLKCIVAIDATINMVRKETHVQSLKLFVMIALSLQGGLAILGKSLQSKIFRLFQTRQASALSVDDFRILCLDLAITSFVVFSYWDIRRVRATEWTETTALLCGTILILFTNPTTVLLLFWGAREFEWANASRKKTVAAK